VTFKTDARGQGAGPESKAIFSVAEVEVTVACPHCAEMQGSPKRWGSRTWSRQEIMDVGYAGVVTCADCQREFSLPEKLFKLLASV
jgi:hypothetical protein